jgi:hypothetical protein
MKQNCLESQIDRSSILSTDKLNQPKLVRQSASKREIINCDIKLYIQVR